MGSTGPEYIEANVPRSSFLGDNQPQLYTEDFNQFAAEQTMNENISRNSSDVYNENPDMNNEYQIQEDPHLYI